MNCGDENESDADYLAALVGEWMVTTMTFSGCPEAEMNGTFDANHSASYHITINSNGTFSMVGECGNETQTGTITDVSATAMTLCETGEVDCTPDNYALVGDVLTINTEDSGCQQVIVLARNMNPADFLTPLVGSWVFKSQTKSNCSDGGASNGSETCTTDCPVLTISSDCSYTFAESGSTTQSGSVIVSSTNIVICPSTEGDCGMGPNADTYSINGTTLTVSGRDTDENSNPAVTCDVTYELEKQ